MQPGMWQLLLVLLPGVACVSIRVALTDWTYIDSSTPDASKYFMLQLGGYIGSGGANFTDVIATYDHTALPPPGVIVTAAWANLYVYPGNILNKNITVAPAGVNFTNGLRDTTWNSPGNGLMMGPHADAQLTDAVSTSVTATFGTYPDVNVSTDVVARWINNAYQDDGSMALVFMDFTGPKETIYAEYCDLFIVYENITTTTSITTPTTTQSTASTASTVAATTSSTTLATTPITTTAPGSSSNLGGIIGGAVGGVAALILGTTAAVIYYRRAIVKPAYTKLQKTPAQRTPKKHHHNKHPTIIV